jgi:hypothetical protein
MSWASWSSFRREMSASRSLPGLVDRENLRRSDRRDVVEESRVSLPLNSVERDRLVMSRVKTSTSSTSSRRKSSTCCQKQIAGWTLGFVVFQNEVKLVGLRRRVSSRDVRP